MSKVVTIAMDTLPLSPGDAKMDKIMKTQAASTWFKLNKKMKKHKEGLWYHLWVMYTTPQGKS